MVASTVNLLLSEAFSLLQVGMHEICPLQVGTPEVCPVEVSTPQVCSF